MAEEDLTKSAEQNWADEAFEQAQKGAAEADTDGADLDWDAAFAEVQAAETKSQEVQTAGNKSPLASGPSPFDEFGDTRPVKTGDRSLDFLLDVPLEVSVELGRTRMVINDLLRMGQGAIIELNRLAGEPVDVFVNGKLLGRGEVVVADEKFGVRLTEIISPADRVKNLA